MTVHNKGYPLTVKEMEYMRDFLNVDRSESIISWENLKPLPPAAFTTDSREFATEVYRIFCDGSGFDCGAPIDFNNVDLVHNKDALIFLLQTWAAFTYPDDAAFKQNWIKNVALLHYYFGGDYGAINDVYHYTDIEDVYELRRLYFIEYAVEAVADSWRQEPLELDHVKQIANAAMEYATKKSMYY